jgi:hypothetical protein
MLASRRKLVHLCAFYALPPYAVAWPLIKPCTIRGQLLRLARPFFDQQ